MSLDPGRSVAPKVSAFFQRFILKVYSKVLSSKGEYFL